MRKIYFLTVLLGLVSLTSFSQSYSISGEVRDAERNLIPGANVMIPELNKGTVTNSKGKYQLNTIPEGSYTLKVTYLGFETIEKLIEVSGDMQLDVTLNEANYMLDGIMVSA
ncbi:carboxypeptidase-like regulatory domain-containing protein [Psychroflexus sp. CAK1W]|nr:carboxypeptidase-like regulatory domain-containing protein [Psychroflexus curvus]MBZ9626483.1 carboxypeptidase-like regulatory domain-containing protein [Psychroflexus curvus]